MVEMRSFRTGAWTFLTAFALAYPAASALAQEGDNYGVADIDVSAHAAIMSDYRFRGLSLSDRDPALQVGVDVAHQSGWYAGTWVSTVGIGDADAEIDFYGGWGRESGGLDYSIGMHGYVFAGDSDLNFVEMTGTLGKTLGPANVELKLAWSPDRKDGRDNLYIGTQADVGIPGTPFTARVKLGRENGAFDEKWDWEAGLLYSRRWLTLSASYVDTNYKGVSEAGRLGRAGLVAGVTARF